MQDFGLKLTLLVVIGHEAGKVAKELHDPVDEFDALACVLGDDLFERTRRGLVQYRRNLDATTIGKADGPWSQVSRTKYAASLQPGRLQLRPIGYPSSRPLRRVSAAAYWKPAKLSQSERNKVERGKKRKKEDKVRRTAQIVEEKSKEATRRRDAGRDPYLHPDLPEEETLFGGGTRDRWISKDDAELRQWDRESLAALRKEDTKILPVDFRAQIEVFQNASAPGKLIRYLRKRAASQELSQVQVVLAVRALQRMPCLSVIPETVPLFLTATPTYLERDTLRAAFDENTIVNVTTDRVDEEADSWWEDDNVPAVVDLGPAVEMIKVLCTLARLEEAEQIAAKMGVLVDPSLAVADAAGMGAFVQAVADLAGGVRRDDIIKSVRLRDPYLAALPEMALGYGVAGDVRSALVALRVLRARIFAVTKVLPSPLGVDLENSTKQGSACRTGCLPCHGLGQFGLNSVIGLAILRTLVKQGSQKQIRTGLRELVALSDRCGSQSQEKVEAIDIDWIFQLTGTFMKDLTLVRGAVSMDQLPAADRPEVVFIGRSNVGKSSLINMLTNRNDKKLAKVSSMPGKTTKLDFYDASALIGQSGEQSRFYLVDVPGVGFAKQSIGTRSQWSAMLRAYTSQRTTLSAVFHLIDSRDGIQPADEECFRLLDSVPLSCQYVVVITKADLKGEGAVRARLVKETLKVVGEYRDRIKFVVTSAETRQGALELWSVMLDSMAGEKLKDSVKTGDVEVNFARGVVRQSDAKLRNPQESMGSSR